MDLKGWADERTKNTHRNFEFLKNENVLRIPTTKYFFCDVQCYFFLNENRFMFLVESFVNQRKFSETDHNIDEQYIH